MKKLLFIFLYFLIPLNVFSEEYLCSGIIANTEIETKSYERKENYFLYSPNGWKFEILHEDDTLLMLGEISVYDSLKAVSLFLTIINKKTLYFSERYMSSDRDNNEDAFFSGNCIIK